MPGGQPTDQLELAIEMLDESSAALDPVTAIAIENTAEIANFGVMDMAADNAVNSAPPRLVGNRVAKRSDILHGILDPLFQIGRKRPIGIA